MADVEGQQDHDAATRVQAIQRGRIARRNAKDDDNTRAVSKDDDEYAGETARLHTLEDVHAENANFAWVSRAVALAFLTVKAPPGCLAPPRGDAQKRATVAYTGGRREGFAGTPGERSGRVEDGDI